MSAIDQMESNIGATGLRPNHLIKKESTIDSTQVGGDHYTSLPIQPWEYLQSNLGPEGFEAYLAGNVIKYLSRYKRKNGVEDLKKAQHYLAKLIEQLA